MKRLAILLAFIFLSSLAHAQTRPPLAKIFIAEWTAPKWTAEAPTSTWSDVQGNPDVIVSFEIAVLPAPMDPNATPALVFASRLVAWDDALQADKSFRADYRNLTKDLGTGIYRFWVRAIDEADQKSVWVSSDFFLDKTPPEGPQRPRAR